MRFRESAAQNLINNKTNRPIIGLFANYDDRIVIFG